MQLAENTDNSTWAGYEVGTPANLDYVTADFIVPTLDCPGSGTYAASIWVGEGGYDSGDTLYQTGISMDCSNGNASYQAWWQIAPTQSSQQDETLSISAGDKIVEEVYTNDTNAYFYLEDYGSNLSNSTPIGTADHTYRGYTGINPETEECIVEDPTDSGTGDPVLFANFDYVNYSTATSGSFNKACDVTANDQDNIISSSSSSLNHLTGVAVLDMVNGSDTLATTDGPSSSGSYNVTWKANS